MATADPCALLNRLVKEPVETPWLEFKHNNSDVQAIGEYISALANSAMLADRDHAYLVFGVDDKTHSKIGTSVRLHKLKKGNEPILTWLNRLISPQLMLEFLDFECENKNFSIICIEPTYDKPVNFSGVEYIRLGESKRLLKNHVEHERALWIATGRRRFEAATAATHHRKGDVFDLLDTEIYYSLSAQPKPNSESEILARMLRFGAITDDMEGGYNITNLGAILFANDINSFPSVQSKSVRLIRYKGTTKASAEYEHEGQMGYALGFSGIMREISRLTPSVEVYTDGVRRQRPMFPPVAVRELVANALIHQDFTVSGSAPIIEMYSDRIEITNPGHSLIDADRMLDERRSRNEKLASSMRELGLCEERGGGLDKALAEIELNGFPAPDFIASPNSMRVVLFGPRSFSSLSRKEKMRACFFHCVLRWLSNDYMSNATLRQRFGLTDKEYQAASGIISQSIKEGRIIPADPNQGKRNARYVPYFAG